MAGSGKKRAAGKRKGEETTEPARASKKRDSGRRKSDAGEALSRPKAPKDAEWTAALGELRIELLPMDAVPFLGSVQLRVVQGSLQLLGSTVGAGSEWHELHSPAGGLPIVLQTASAVSRPAVIVLRRINRGLGASLADATASDAPRASTAEASEAEVEAVAAEAVEAVEAVDAPAAEAGTEPMVEGDSPADPSPLNVNARTPMLPDLPQLVSAALSAVTPGDVAEATPRAPATPAAPATPVAPATPAVGAVVSVSSARAPPPPPLGALSPLGPVWGGASAHEPRTARALDLMTRYLTLRPLPAPAEVGLRGWMPDEWEAAADELVGSMWRGGGGKGGAEPRAPRLLLCGGRNVGKSSFARFLVNRALSAAPGGAPVCFLDTDVGQSELSAPGLVSLHVLGAPLLGPPHTHVRPAAVSCCVGDASPGTDPHHFLRCVGFVLAAYRRDFAAHPLIINTCGYATGLGAQLLADVLQAACPTVVVHLDKPPPARAGREQEPSELAALVDACGVRVMALPPLQLASLLAPSSDYRPGPLLPSAPSAADLRTLQLLAYFGALPPATHALPGGAEGFLEAAWQRALCAFAARAPYAVPRAAVYVCCMHASVTDVEVLRALNATLVGLGTYHRDDDPDAEPAAAAAGGGVAATAMVLRRPPACACVGYAVVRCVDAARGLLYLDSPEPPARLARANVLLRGSLEMPLAMLLPTDLTAASPYLTTEGLKGAGAAAQRSRNNLNRHTTQGPA